MKLQLDLTKEYGLVLEGGGAKGSYQIGAWKALKEAGVSIKGVSGASVGALNGALICMDSLELAEYIWENISYSRVMDVDDFLMEQVQNRDFKALDMSLLAAEARKILKDKGLDITPLRELIAAVIDEEKIRRGSKDLYITTYSVSDRKLLTIDVKTLGDGDMGDMLMASAYLPVFKREKLGGRHFLDGGGWNNVPTDALLEREYKDIIIIRIYGLGFDSEKVTEIPEGTRVYHIAPRQSLGGLLQFDKKQARKNMKLGYYDGLKFLYGLEGRWYYLDAPEPEAYYLTRLMEEKEGLRELIPEELRGRPEDRPDESERYRFDLEVLFPRLAKEWKMKEDWNYKDMYLGILENAARSRRIGRFCIYTPEELQKKIWSKRRSEL
ncbi:MAG: patatin-like phospholipase family protein [Hungatella sp.]|nr:patatin-like phospholipase family protein [Hungatella sp.]